MSNSSSVRREAVARGDLRNALNEPPDWEAASVARANIAFEYRLRDKARKARIS